MCGIAGIAGPGASRALIERMTRALIHRGPDSFGFHRDGDLYLGHTRLEIIDLETGDQPMSNPGRSLWLVYNGEIYNFRELRRELESRGRRFRTASDSEVILQGFEDQGVRFFSRLDGIFAFALWQAPERRLYLVRDPFGIKPLHYHLADGTLRFGSEIKALLRDPRLERNLDVQALHFFLNLRYIPGERTLLAGIRRVPKAHYLLWEAGRLSRHRYFRFEALEHGRRDEGYYEEGIRHYLREAVRKQLVSDVPLGVYLSGGLDSSSIVAFASELTSRPVKTFAMGFNEPTDELEDARHVAEHFGAEHREIALDAEPLRDYPRVIWHAEEPKENILQGYLLARFARREVKVALGGLGGDELFAGYVNNRFIRPSEPLHRLVPRSWSRSLLAPLSRALFRLQNATGVLRLDEARRGLQMLLASGDPARYYLILRNVWDYDRGAFANVYGPALRGHRFEPTQSAFDAYFAAGNRDLTDRVLAAEIDTKMVDDFLLNEDRTSMAHGLEVRVPFLDRDLVRFCLGIPVDLKIRRSRTKLIFRRAMAPVLPRRTLHKRKWGFSFNPYHQFQKDLKPVAERILTRERVEARGWFNYAYLRRVIDHPPHPRLRWHYFFLWLVTGLEIWCSMFLDGGAEEPSLELESYF